MDHPKIEHGWLWDIFGSGIRSNVGTDDILDEDLPGPPPRQEANAPENFIDIPDPSRVDSPSVRRRRAAEEWRRKRGMSYETAFIPA